jgi:hypothetical protein
MDSLVSILCVCVSTIAKFAILSKYPCQLAAFDPDTRYFLKVKMLVLDATNGNFLDKLVYNENRYSFRVWQYRFTCINQRKEIVTWPSPSMDQ